MKAFFGIDLIVILWAAVMAYVRWDIPLYLCAGIALLALLLTYTCAKQLDKRSADVDGIES
ncbi:hypothetical protein [Halobacillus sp. BAB-2008]|uniref:hypothetical protein n=1 Tax=Halobacillus sp. BAB-2008 TaxID=1246484 RepID=UPI0002A4F301|nr:hypothetical protein [Halobacillus sp. BAB-2008]ELK45669.1 hypothetical protein D479_14047 [Halobacillus sp. BAB-2008]